MFECVPGGLAVHGLQHAPAFAARICGAHNRVLPAGAGGPPSRLSGAVAQQLELLSASGAARFAAARVGASPSLFPVCLLPGSPRPPFLPRSLRTARRRLKQKAYQMVRANRVAAALSRGLERRRLVAVAAPGAARPCF
jgi:hypothetical protein